MAPELQREALQQIETEVKFGFYTEEEIVERTQDYLYDEEDVDVDWIKQQTKEVFQRYLNESRQWKRPTDFDRLSDIFDGLTRNDKIICLHLAGNTKQEGYSDSMDVYEALKQQGVTAAGYCFYHAQDLERAVDVNSRKLLLAFGSFDENEAGALLVGKKIDAALNANGFTTSWDATVDERIEIQNINWQKTPGEQGWDVQRPVKLLTEKKPSSKPWWKLW